MNKDTIFACFGGFGPQYWTSISSPNIEGKCDQLTICTMDTKTGEMKEHSCVEGIKNPGTVVVSPDQKFIYAANEDHDFMERGYGGGVSAFSFDIESGNAKLINQSLSYGASAAYINLDKTGRFLFVANHGSKFYCTRFVEKDGVLEPKVIRDEGCISMFEIREDGGIGRLLDRLVLDGTGADPVEHASAHPHSVMIDDEDMIVIPNKGGDSICVCRLDREAKKMRVLSVCKIEYGSSPRHAAFVKGTPYVLVQNEFDGHLCSYSLDRKTGELTRISRLDNSDPNEPFDHPMLGKKHPWGVDVQIHPNGRFAYTNNTQNVISLFYINRDTGELSLEKQHKIKDVIMSRGMQIDCTGTFLVVTGMASEKAAVFRICPKTGELTRVSEIGLPTPTALRFIYP